MAQNTLLWAGGGLFLIGAALYASRRAIAPAAPEIASSAREIKTAYPTVGTDLAQRIAEVAISVGAHPNDLASLIALESAGTFSPVIENIGCRQRHGPRSGKCAVGLIQFMPFTAAELFGWEMEGTTSSGRPQYTADQKKRAFERMRSYSAMQQMDYVQQYLQTRSRSYGPLDTPYKVAMSVFYPVAIRWDPDREFSALIQEQNPGISTPGDYARKLFEGARLPLSSSLA